MMDTVRLIRGEHEPVDVMPSQVTPLSVARMFSVSQLAIKLARLFQSGFLSVASLYRLAAGTIWQ